MSGGYSQQTWVDGSGGGTPINATRLNHMEAGIVTAASKTLEILVTDPNANSSLNTGTNKAAFRIPLTLDGFHLTAIAGHVTTASTSGIPSIQINNVTQAFNILLTDLTIDANENDSSTAATPAVIDTSGTPAKNLATVGERWRIDVDVAGTGTKGLIVEFTFT